VGHLGYFYSLAIVNSAAINMDVQVPLLYPDLNSFGYISPIFSFLRCLYAVFHSGCTNLYSLNSGNINSENLHSHKYLFVFLIIAILTGMKCNLNVI
jgi:hypothetical protein